MIIDTNMIVGGFFSLLGFAIIQWNRMGKNDKATNGLIAVNDKAINGRVDVLESRLFATNKDVSEIATELKEFINDHTKNERDRDKSMNDKLDLIIKQVQSVDKQVAYNTGVAGISLIKGPNGK